MEGVCGRGLSEGRGIGMGLSFRYDFVFVYLSISEWFFYKRLKRGMSAHSINPFKDLTTLTVVIYIFTAQHNDATRFPVTASNNYLCLLSMPLSNPHCLPSTMI